MNDHTRERVAELEERVRQLEDVLFDRTWVPASWRLTALETRILNILTVKGTASREQLITGMYWDREPPDQPLNVIDALICRMRRKLRGIVSIENVWGQGFRLRDDSRLFIAEMMRAA